MFYTVYKLLQHVENYDLTPLMKLSSRLHGRERREKEEIEVPENSRETEEKAYASSDMQSLVGRIQRLLSITIIQTQ